jgi:hypothetical protein
MDTTGFVAFKNADCNPNHFSNLEYWFWKLWKRILCLYDKLHLLIHVEAELKRFCLALVAIGRFVGHCYKGRSSFQLGKYRFRSVLRRSL